VGADGAGGKLDDGVDGARTEKFVGLLEDLAAGAALDVGEGQVGELSEGVGAGAEAEGEIVESGQCVEVALYIAESGVVVAGLGEGGEEGGDHLLGRVGGDGTELGVGGC